MRFAHSLLLAVISFASFVTASPMPNHLSSRIESLRAQGMSEVRGFFIKRLLSSIEHFKQRDILSTLNNLHPSPAITNSGDAWSINLDDDYSPGAGWQPQGDEGRPKWLFSWLRPQSDGGKDEE